MAASTETSLSRRRPVTVCGLSETTAAQLVQAVEIYGESFPPNESRPVGDVMSLLARGRYSMSVAVQESPGGAAAVGFMLLYPLGHDAALLDYMAVRRDVQGCGIGGIMIGHLSEYLLGEYPTILLEAQLARGGGNTARRDRIRFYERHGARTLTDRYVMPGYGPDSEETMKLMHLGREPRAGLEEIIGDIHEQVYGRRSGRLLDEG